MNKIQIEDNKNNIVKKQNDLINKARYSLNELEIKIVSTLISMIRKDDTEFHEYYVDIKELQKLTNTSTKDNQYYIDIAKSLMSKPFNIDNKVFNWVTFAEHKQDSTMLKFEIHRYLKPYLLELQKNFTQYNIKDIMMLKSAYVIRLYELIISEYTQYKNYHKSATKYTFDLQIDYLRELFEIPESFKYNDIKRHIIDKAQTQFKEKTNIQFTYKEEKIGRKVNSLSITVFDNNKGSNDVLATRKAFVAYIRETYKPIPQYNHFPIVLTTRTGDLKINSNGEIYRAGEDITHYDAKESDKIWNDLYAYAKKHGLSKLNKADERHLLS